MEKICFFLTVGLCILFFIIGLLRKKMDLLVNFLLRGAMGLIGIYLVNELLLQCNIRIAVGFNSLSTMVVGLLGVPGFFFMYGVATYFHLSR